MNLTAIREEFRERISEQIDLHQQGEGRFIVRTPFRFDDGDHFVIALKREGDGWILTDEASTIMHLSYWLDTDAIESGNRKQIVDSSLSSFAVENRDGELVIPVIENRFGDALFDFVQALSKVTDISFLSREVVRSTFMDDLRAFLKSRVPEHRIEFDWRDDRDSTGKYPVDFRINQMKRPILIYGLPNEDKMNVATISLLTFERWGLKFQSVGIFEDQESIQRKPLARFTDVIGKSYSNLHDNRERIVSYLDEALRES
ncbi:MAG: DUF1828 domain-containing protein [Candidatus Pacebacteria bacterium]|nr:DUF1828 domain-containing protein [Candidatus Paceibacterota bacterium]